MGMSNIRIGTATSSTIFPIISEGRATGTIGSPFFTYVEECRFERGLLQVLENSVEVLATEWGKTVESFVHELLPKGYKFHSNKTLKHPKYPGWVGSPDGTLMKYILEAWMKDATTDIKCPQTKKAFCQLLSGLYKIKPTGGVDKIENPDSKKVLAAMIKNANDGKKFYWQLVSNSCIENTKYAELIVFMPFKENLERILKYNESLDFENDKNRNDGKPKHSMLVSFAGLKENKLPSLIKESGYEEVNIIRFEVPLEDKKLLEKRYRILNAIVDMESDIYEKFMDQAEAVKFKEDDICDLIFALTKERIK